MWVFNVLRLWLHFDVGDPVRVYFYKQQSIATAIKRPVKLRRSKRLVLEFQQQIADFQIF